MIEVWIKAVNRSINSVIYEGLKKSYEHYLYALHDMQKLLKKQNAYITSFQLPNEILWKRGKSCYITCRHGNCRTTIYIKQS